MTIKLWVRSASMFLAFIALPAAADHVVMPNLGRILPDFNGLSPNDSPSGGDVASAQTVACMMKSVGVNNQKTAQNVVTALKDVKFPSGTFTNVSLEHFLAQTKAESDCGQQNTQQGAVSQNKKGFGMIQVTGEANLANAQACMNQAAPGQCAGALQNPEAVCGQSAKNPLCPVLVSLCWWRTNIISNQKNDDASKTASSDGVQQITRVVTGAQTALQARQDAFNKIQGAGCQ